MKLGIYTAILIGLVPMLLFPLLHSQAATFIVEDERTDVTIREEIQDDLYTIGNVILLDAEIRDDAFVIGRDAMIRGVINQDLYVLSNTVRIEGRIGDDAHALGKTITVEADIAGDAFMAGETVHILSDSRIGEDAYLYGESVVIAGEIAGNSVVRANHVRITSDARLQGDLRIHSQHQPFIEEGANIAGTVDHRIPPTRPRALPARWVKNSVSLFVLSFLLIYILPHKTQTVLKIMKRRPGRSLALGFLWMLLFLPAAVTMGITYVGIPLAIILATSTITLYIAATGYAVLMIGSAIMNRLQKTEGPASLLWTHALLGAVIYATLQLLGAIGFLVLLLITLAALGAILRTIWNGARREQTSS